MTEEFKTLANELDSAFFRYAHITGALEFYMLVLENPSLLNSNTLRNFIIALLHRSLNFAGKTKLVTILSKERR